MIGIVSPLQHGHMPIPKSQRGLARPCPLSTFLVITVDVFCQVITVGTFFASEFERPSVVDNFVCKNLRHEDVKETEKRDRNSFVFQTKCRLNGSFVNTQLVIGLSRRISSLHPHKCIGIPRTDYREIVPRNWNPNYPFNRCKISQPNP